MKLYASALAACATAMALPVQAGSFTSTIQDTVRMEVQGAGVSMTRLGSEYSASGVGVKGAIPSTGTTPLFSSTASGSGSSTYAPSAYSAASSDGTFQFKESFRAADLLPTPAVTNTVANGLTTATTGGFTSTQSTGELTAVNMYGEATIQYAGTAGTIGVEGVPAAGSAAAVAATGTTVSMPLVQSTTGPNSVQASTGGPSFTIAPDANGIIGIAQRSISLSVWE
jgi:hypothetical protein